MIYYRRYMGSYQKRTTRLSMRDHGAYTLMLDFYYAEEQPLPLEHEDIYDICKARTPDDRKSVEKVLRLHFEPRDDGYHNARADGELAASQQARKNGAEGGRPPKTGSRTGTVTGSETGSVTKTQTGKVTEDITGRGGGEGGGSVHPSTYSPSTVQPYSPSTDQPSTDSPGETAAPGTLPSSGETPETRAGTLCGSMSKALRDEGVTNVTPSHPTLVAWQRQGVTIQVLREAVDLARDQKPKPEPIPFGYLIPIVERLRTPGPGSASAPAALDWWATPEGIKAEATKRGIEPDGHNLTWLRCAIAVAVGGDHWPWIDPRNGTEQRFIREIREAQEA